MANIVERSIESRSILTDIPVKNWENISHFQFSLIFSANRSFYLIESSVNFDQSKLTEVDFN